MITIYYYALSSDLTTAINGKAASSHTHAIYGDRLDKLMRSDTYRLPWISTANLNDIDTVSLLNIQKTDTNNCPGNGWWDVITLPHVSSAGYSMQIAIAQSDSYKVYVRYKNGSNWKAWSRFSVPEHTHSNYASASKIAVQELTFNKLTNGQYALAKTSLSYTYLISLHAINNNNLIITRVWADITYLYLYVWAIDGTTLNLATESSITCQVATCQTV